MTIRDLTQKALRTTATKLYKLDIKLNRSPKEDFIALLKDTDIPTDVLIDTMTYLEGRLAKLEADNA